MRSDTILAFDIYVQYAGSAPVLFRNRELPITPYVLSRLADNRHEAILISVTQQEEYARYVESHLNELVLDQSIPIAERSEVLYSAATMMMESIFNSPDSPDMLKRSKNMVSTTASLLIHEKGAFANLVNLASHDYYTYTHSVNVFVYSFTLAHRSGLAKGDRLQEFGEGALLHDVGKARIDQAIIRNPGKLSDEQWQEMRRHPSLGCDIAQEKGVTSALVLDVIRHHHERLGGGGYPDNLSGSRISPLVRVSTIADIFDALTTERPYRAALGTFPALTMMRDKMIQDLDPDLFHLFVSIMGNPAG